MSSVMPFKVCDSLRQTRHIVFATGTINSLIEQVTIKFQRPFNQIVLANDGCELSSDMALTAFSKELLMLLEPGETWTPEGFNVLDTQAQNSAEGLQNTSDGQLVVSSGQNTLTTDKAAMPMLQTLNIDPAIMTIFPNQHVSVAEPLSMNFFAGGDELYQPSTSQQRVVVDCLTKNQENNEEILDQASIVEADDPVDENQSPNATNKRSRPIGGPR